MKTIIHISTFAFAVAGCIAFNACQKSVDATSPSNPVIPSVQQATQMDAANVSFTADNFDNDVYNIDMSNTSDEGLSGGSRNTPGANKPVVIYSPSATAYPHTMTINYGTGYTNQFGIVKTGKIVSYYSAPLAQSGAEVITTFQNYTYAGNQIAGLSSIQNITCGTDANLVFHHVSQRNVIFTSGNSSSLITDKVYFMVSSPNVPGVTVNNKENYISGSTIGTDIVSGVNCYWVATIDPLHLLHKMSTCQYNDKGVVNAMVYPLSSKTAIAESLDYGDGTCDNTAIISYKGSSEVIELPMQVWPIN